MNRIVVAYMGLMVLLVTFLPKGHESDMPLARWAFISLTVAFAIGVLEGWTWKKGGWNR